LVAQGVNPAEYISFYSLRTYDLIRDKNKCAPGEALLAKYVAVDDAKEAQIKVEKEKHESHIASLFHKVFSSKEVEIKTEILPDDIAKAVALQDVAKGEAWVTEMIYIHTKLMIIDDRFLICGSANLNDRSMCGNRDSEIAAVIEDKTLIDSVMDGKPYKVGKLVHQLRLDLCREHLGLTMETQMKVLAFLPPDAKPPVISSVLASIQGNSDAALHDPLSDAFWKLWDGTAHNNTSVYRKLFHNLPDDNITTWAELKAFRPNTAKILPGHIREETLTGKEIQENLFKIQGQLVVFPTNFLNKEVLRAKKLSAEEYTPEDVFT